jgi:hypothetical protein
VTDNVLAHITVPAADFPEPLLYVRSESNGRDGAALSLSAGQRATFDTAFGLFPAGRWRRLTSLSDVAARMHVDGRARVNLVAVTGEREDIIDSVEVDGGTAIVSLPNLDASSIGTLFVTVTAIDGRVLVHGGEWTTTMAPTRNVTLGVAITTFNRQDYVLKTINRLVDLEQNVAELSGRLKVVVVDNAQNLKPELAEKIKQAFFSFKWEGTTMAAEFNKAEPPQEKFMPITYKQHWAVVREIDKAMNVSYVCKIGRASCRERVLR